MDLLDPALKAALCSWVPPDNRDTVMKQEDARIAATMPPMRFSGTSAEPKDGKAYHWDIVRRFNGGKDTLCFYQLEGSCVGQGMTGAGWEIQFMEVARGELQKVIMPYMPYTYGMSRVCAGINARWHGSTGRGAAEAAKKYGFLRSDLPGLPAIQEIKDQTLIWGKQLENMWMNGAPSNFHEEGKLHTIQTISQCKNTDDLRTLMINGYSATCASNWGGRMKPPIRGSGKNARLLNDHADTWNHQMRFCGWEDNPELGELFYIRNSWSQSAHGECPSGAPLGGFWITKRDAQFIIDQGEVFGISQFADYPLDQIPWIF